MRTVQEPLELVQQVLGRQKRISDTNYRLLTYVVKRQVEDGVLLYNIMTKELVLLNHEEAKHLQEQHDLIARWFLVPEKHDDKKLSCQLSAFAKMLQPSADYIKNYTIFTTTDCNARCFYCFEKENRRVHMTEKTAHDTSDYIIRHHGTEEVTLGWFGGEPLYNHNVIDIICQDLKEADVKYHSSMASNGYLFDDEIIQKAKTLWNLRKVQITLDGTEEIYNRTKRYIYKDSNAYQRVMNNIEKLLKADINVNIRLNIDKHNFSNIEILIEELAQRFAQYKHIKVYVKGLYESAANHPQRTDNERITITDKIIEFENRIVSLGLGRVNILHEGIKLNWCMMDSPHSITILPSGNIGKCEHFLDSGFIGHVTSDKVDEVLLKEYLEHLEDEEACNTCAFYPMCLRPKKCDLHKKCTPERRKVLVYRATDAMFHTYENIL